MKVRVNFNQADGYLHVGTGGQGGSAHANSSKWHSKALGQLMSSQGSRHRHMGQPSLVRANPWGQNILQVASAHGFGAEINIHKTFSVILM